MKEQIKNALKFLKPKEKEPIPDFYLTSLSTVLGNYFNDVKQNAGKDSQQIYEEYLTARILANTEGKDTLRGLTDALSVIENYRNWEAKELGWK